MMLVTVNRIPNINGVTLSTCFVDQRFMCFGIEDQQGVMKIPGKTAIYEGRYKVGIRTTGSWHERMAKAHPLHHHGMLEILNVPHFTDILIHPGNTIQDSAGCYLPNFGLNFKPGTDPSGINSTKAYWHLYNTVIAEAIAGRLNIQFQTLVEPGARYVGPFPYLTIEE